jgi:hypothetical protein
MAGCGNGIRVFFIVNSDLTTTGAVWTAVGARGKVDDGAANVGDVDSLDGRFFSFCFGTTFFAHALFLKNSYLLDPSELAFLCLGRRSRGSGSVCVVG